MNKGQLVRVLLKLKILLHVSAKTIFRLLKKFNHTIYKKAYEIEKIEKFNIEIHSGQKCL